MGRPTVCLLLTVLLRLTATLPGPTMGQAEESGGSTQKATTASITPTTMTREDENNHCLLRRQDLINAQLKNEIDTRLNERDSPLNELDTRLTMQLIQRDNRQNEFDTRLNRIDNRLDKIETAITDMKEYLLQKMEDMDKKVEWVMKDIQRKEACTTQQDQGDGRVKDMPQVYGGCEDVVAHGLNTSGVYTIALKDAKSMEVYCEQRLDGGGWMVFQARSNGYVDFNQDWNTYKTGFGNLTEEFWLGNEALHKLTTQHVYQLRVELMNVDGEVQYADYNQFSVSDENDKYRLDVTGYTGGTIPGDAMRHQHGSQFSTKEQNNDAQPGTCRSQHVGGWWYKGCNYAKLNDHYDSEDVQKFMFWYTWKPVKSLKRTRMMIRKIQ